MAEKEAFRKFPSAWGEEHVDPDIRRRTKAEREESKFHRFRQMQEVDTEAELRRMYNNPTTEFRGMQKEALGLIVGGHPRVVVIMRTGGGKSLLFMLPAIASRGGLAIVVVDRRGLEEGVAVEFEAALRRGRHQIHRLERQASAAVRFEDRVRHRRVGGIEDVRGFHQFEEDGASRPTVRRLHELTGKSVQVVCLTAILPPKKQPGFLAAIDIEERQAMILRDVTTRPNIAYSVEDHDAGEEDEAVRGLVERKKAQYPAGNQIIVYCRSIDQTKHLEEVLGCTALYREAGTDTEKEAILEKLTKQKERVFTSTNALGEGIDAPSIRVIIHVGVVDSLDDYGQQSGRAGRDGKTASEAIVMRKMFVGKDGKRKAERKWKTEPEMKEFLQSDVCRRVVMDRYMDGCSEGRPERRACEAGNSGAMFAKYEGQRG
ncbi:hypothetical protein LTR66_008409 [Elasticomyces elasticus]|nr:hypothetical protein LTR66_008409 [Elasticomyces elasticus]